MAKTYEECCKEVGLDISKIEPPVQVKNWYAYVEGKAIKCETQAEAKKHKLHEVVLDPVSKAEILKFWDGRRVQEEEAAVLFRDSLREDHQNMSPSLFDLCYTAAQEKGRSSDYEEIPDNFKYFATFAQQAIKLRK